MSDGEVTRQHLEQAIIAASEKIAGLHPDGEKCFDEAVIDDFFECWRELLAYYEKHSDNDIGVEVVREYIENQNNFARWWKYIPNVDEPCREEAEEALSTLENYMERIIWAVERRIYPNGR